MINMHFVGGLPPYIRRVVESHNTSFTDKVMLLRRQKLQYQWVPISNLWSYKLKFLLSEFLQVLLQGKELDKLVAEDVEL